MKILIYSPSFYPNIGGLETIISTLAHEFIYQGHEVKLISQTPATDSKQFPFEVIRQPSKKQLLQLTHWCEIYFQGCVSLKGIWPLIFIPRPLIITHQTWYCRTDGSESWQDYLKKFITRFATNISVSHAIAKALPTQSTVIPNSYREDIFYEIPEINRNQELVFLGRLVSDKGANLLLEALAQLKSKGLTPQLTIIGTGPEESKLIQQIMVVPSLWDEPFGIVALEGIACGCVVVGSEGGGLKDAIGPCGVTFANSNVEQLTKALFNLLTNSEQLITYRERAKSHLARHSSKAVAKTYLDVLQDSIK